PKGHMESLDSSSLERAQTEAWEEAGVKGRAQSEALGHFHYAKNGKLCRVEVFLLLHCELADDWPEKGQWTRILVSPSAAAEMVQEPGLELLLAARDPQEDMRP